MINTSYYSILFYSILYISLSVCLSLARPNPQRDENARVDPLLAKLKIFSSPDIIIIASLVLWWLNFFEREKCNASDPQERRLTRRARDDGNHN